MWHEEKLYVILPYFRICDLSVQWEPLLKPKYITDIHKNFTEVCKWTLTLIQIPNGNLALSLLSLASWKKKKKNPRYVIQSFEINFRPWNLEYTFCACKMWQSSKNIHLIKWLNTSIWCSRQCRWKYDYRYSKPAQRILEYLNIRIRQQLHEKIPTYIWFERNVLWNPQSLYFVHHEDSQILKL